METKNYWLDKKVKIQIIKEGRNLFYTATIIEINENSISFLDRTGETYCFSREFIKEMKEIKGAD